MSSACKAGLEPAVHISESEGNAGLVRLACMQRSDIPPDCCQQKTDKFAHLRCPRCAFLPAPHPQAGATGPHGYRTRHDTPTWKGKHMATVLPSCQKRFMSRETQN